MRAFVVLGLVFSMIGQETTQTSLAKRLRNDLFCVEWDVKPQLNQSIRFKGIVQTVASHGGSVVVGRRYGTSSPVSTGMGDRL